MQPKRTLYVTGATLAVLGCIGLVVANANRYAGAHGGHDLQGLWIPAICLVVTGAGLVLRSRVAFLLLLGETLAITGRLIAILVTQPEHRAQDLAFALIAALVFVTPLIICWRARTAFRVW